MILYDAGYFKTTDGKRHKYREDAIYAQNNLFFRRIKEIAKMIHNVYYIKADTSDEVKEITRFIYRGDVPPTLKYLCFRSDGSITTEASLLATLTEFVNRNKYDIAYYQKQITAMETNMKASQVLIDEFKEPAKVTV